MFRAVVKGIGSYLPEKVLTNFELESMMDTTDEWITQRTGIRERRIAEPEDSTSDLAAKAGLAALQDSGLEKDEIDCLLVATSSPDHIFPPVACLVQEKLGLEKVAGFDISATCTGFIVALSTAESYIKSGRFKNILVIGAETLSRLVNWQDRTTCILFADGAGAFVVSRADEGHDSKGIMYSSIRMNGKYYNDLFIPAGGSKEPVTAEALIEGRNKIYMDGKKIFKLAVNAMLSVAKESLEATELSLEEIDWVLPHQANGRIIEAVAKGLGMAMEKVVYNIEKCGNNSTATIPIALDAYYRSGKIKKGDKILMAAFGGGLTYGSVILEL